MGAMEDEVRLIRADLDEVEELDGSCELLRGRLDGTAVVLAQCGIGKVNTALAASAMVQAGATSIVFTGVAGAVAAGLKIGDVVVGNRFIQHDADDTAFGHPIGVVPGEPPFWEPDPDLFATVFDAVRTLDEPRGHRVVAGTIVSGDQFIAQAEKVAWLRATFEASAVEMEGAALAQAAHHLGVPFAVVRILSDSGDGDAAVDFPAFLNDAAHRGRDLAHVLARVLRV
ncbi:5'-methylthioadenosine/adenosylhomocysteine nucleosidase [Cutibacterium sp. WCA-380-WT-3A]|uniref:adenosylhomocysteine nucleosidase n=1 Tax=Cutibacterium porci TaxID=2605781 RepID=A0A7K0J6K6_9ACTN|nr:5'-methylthioadenosine/adenosylhomocysteine nucleosidase [Cutibacterium porci]MSS45562.1 5'-methylthioadenosine/adenosylhomocysteine nucleosidase [Cutibacterium porci]